MIRTDRAKDEHKPSAETKREAEKQAEKRREDMPTTSAQRQRADTKAVEEGRKPEHSGAKEASPRLRTTSADQLKDRDEPAPGPVFEEDVPTPEPSSRVDVAILERVYDANATIIKKGETNERLEVFMQDGRPQIWWGNFVRTHRVNAEDEEFLLGRKVKERREADTHGKAAVDRDEADRANRISKEDSDRAAAEQRGR
jgi:hypothetical protein